MALPCCSTKDVALWPFWPRVHTHKKPQRGQEGTGKGPSVIHSPAPSEARVKGQKPEGARTQRTVDFTSWPRGDPGAPLKNLPLGPSRGLERGP